jgi:hypothetical protein
MNTNLIRTVARILVLALLGAVGAVGIVRAAADSLSTGVSVDERIPRKEYSLLLTFAEAKGAYLANIAVEIKNAEGKVVLTKTSEGPWLFVKLPAGEYRVSATRSSGLTRAATVTVPETGQAKAYITW